MNQINVESKESRSRIAYTQLETSMNIATTPAVEIAEQMIQKEAAISRCEQTIEIDESFQLKTNIEREQPNLIHYHA